MNCRHMPLPTLEDTAIVPAELPAVTADTLVLRNRLLRRRAPWLGQWAGQALRIEWQMPAAPIADPLVFGLRIGDAAAGLRLSSRLLQCLLEPLALTGRFEALPPLAQGLLIEQVLLPLIEPLERQLGETIQIAEAAEHDWPLTLDVQVTLGERLAEPLHLHLSAAVAERAAQLFETHLAEAPRPLAGLRLPLCLQAGWQWLTRAELHSLRPGDVLMLDQLDDADLLLELDGVKYARARREHGKAHLLEALQAIDPIKERPMSRVIDEQDTPVRLDDLQIKVVCQLGTLELSLAQLQGLGEGSVLELPGSETDAVELTVNGCSVGRGELVRIGAGLGVRLTRFIES